MTMPRLRRSSSLYKAELIRNQGPWEDIDVARARHRRVGALGGHHPTILRHRYASPCRARSRLGTRPPPPGTITTGNHRHQINQPPQNPGLDKAFVAECKALGMAQSTGAADSSADNALAESNGAASKREVLMDASSWGAELTCRSQTFR